MKSCNLRLSKSVKGDKYKKRKGLKQSKSQGENEFLFQKGSLYVMQDHVVAEYWK